MPRRKDNWLGELAPGQFAGANSERLDQAPAHCPHPYCGGVWRECDEGLVCRTCGRRWRVQERLRAMVGRQYLQRPRT